MNQTKFYFKHGKHEGWIGLILFISIVYQIVCFDVPTPALAKFNYVRAAVAFHTLYHCHRSEISKYACATQNSLATVHK